MKVCRSLLVIASEFTCFIDVWRLSIKICRLCWLLTDNMFRPFLTSFLSSFETRESIVLCYILSNSDDCSLTWSLALSYVSMNSLGPWRFMTSSCRFCSLDGVDARFMPMIFSEVSNSADLMSSDSSSCWNRLINSCCLSLFSRTCD